MKNRCGLWRPRRGRVSLPRDGGLAIPMPPRVVRQSAFVADGSPLLHVSVRVRLCGQKGAASRRAPSEYPRRAINAVKTIHNYINCLSVFLPMGNLPVSGLAARARLALREERSAQHQLGDLPVNDEVIANFRIRGAGT